ncbi:MAG: dihydropteroate synthase [SAR324 cluster bacterium]|nr:dihydropteroate synthase [SAR324 cluster bacterium]
MSQNPKNTPGQLYSINRTFSLHRPILVGILNLTPDSFSDGGRFKNQDQILNYFQEMVNHGADWIDIGGESSGPGTDAVSTTEELHRIIPIIKAIRQESDIWISVDTYKAEVAEKAVEAGADAVNDITALRGDPEMIKFLAKTEVPVIITYSKDPDARTTKKQIDYEDVIETIYEFFKKRLVYMQNQGIPIENVIIDPGMGFYISSLPHYSFEIIRRLPELAELGRPIMVGTSRKSFLANVSSGKTLSVHQREIPTAVSTSIAVWQGASLLRVHDVKQGRLVLDTMYALQNTQ